MTATERAERTARADELCRTAYAISGCPETGVALVAVGGYGRQELARHSDLDVLLVHDEDVAPGTWAGELWYPLWDSGERIDHAVRSLGEVVEQTEADLRVALGLLDVRHVAGDPNLTLRLRAAVLAGWRRQARMRLPDLHRIVADRGRLLGELAHAAVPDLKESTGGLRDATVLKALVASWLVDVPHTELESCRTALLDVRDALHQVAGRGTDRVLPEHWEEMAAPLGLVDAAAVQRHTRLLGRRITHLSRLAWRRADAVLRRPPRAGSGRRPRLERIGGGLAIAYEEVVLGRDVRPAEDPALLLRAAAEAAERGLVLEPTTAARLVAESPELPAPWPAEARDLLVRLLAAGPGLLAVWETLEETGAVGRFLPEWERIRLLPHASVVHRFTVDRHLVETCIEAAALIRRVSRPDVLVVAALLHDIGKGGIEEHAAAGEPLARVVAARIGFDERETELVGSLVRRHLLLPVIATTRDPEDPATVAHVLERVHDREELDLLAALTEADARATAESAWSSWRSRLVGDLVCRCAAALGDPPDSPADAPVVVDEVEVPIPGRVLADPAATAVEVESGSDGSVVRVVSGERVGLLADVAAALGLARVRVRSARAWPQEHAGRSYGVSRWSVGDHDLDAAVLRQRLDAVVSGRVDPAARLGDRDRAGLEPAVVVRPEASARSTVLEVRAEDRPGLVYVVCAALARQRISVRSAHVSTLGPQAVDVFYLQEEGAGRLSDERAAVAAHAVRDALRDAR